jgi:hypothetical protein
MLLGCCLRRPRRGEESWHASGRASRPSPSHDASAACWPRGGLASLGSTRLLNTDSAVGGIVLPAVLPCGGGAVGRVARIGSASAGIV